MSRVANTNTATMYGCRDTWWSRVARRQRERHSTEENLNNMHLNADQPSGSLDSISR